MTNKAGGLDNLHSLIRDEQLIHPLATDRPTTIEAFQALRDLCGPPSATTTPASEQAEEFIGSADHYVIVLVDGMGDCFRNYMPEHGFCRNAAQLPLVTGFPSATAPMLTSFASTTWPAEHGITGWDTYFRELSRTLQILPFRESHTGFSGTELGLSLDSLFGVHSWHPAAERPMLSVMPRKLVNSEFSCWARGNGPARGYKNYNQAARHIHHHVRNTPSGMVYCYIPTVDSRAHHYGCSSIEVQRAVYEVDRWLAELRRRLPSNTRVLALADHGLRDTVAETYFEIHENDPIMQFLAAPPSGEPGVPIFHVIPGHEAGFLEYFQSLPLSRHFLLLTPDEIDRLHLFGPEPISSVMRGHLGSYIGISHASAVVEFVPHGRKARRLKAVHGGLKPEEMYVTLYAQ